MEVRINLLIKKWGLYPYRHPYNFTRYRKQKVWDKDIRYLRLGPVQLIF